ncbi:hypothetical protein HJG60_011621 [Phyllostomus discolor]|uniref:Uncharacterized protein n=1 Tax=Phyllostomus discolor TaxID=89673 RepID=A0A833ZN31_9CHIR|nr:hypothetical protein HJG60_011621 [Phyllostomus discolor]
MFTASEHLSGSEVQTELPPPVRCVLGDFSTSVPQTLPVLYGMMCMLPVHEEACACRESSDVQGSEPPAGSRWTGCAGLVHTAGPVACPLPVSPQSLGSSTGEKQERSGRRTGRWGPRAQPPLHPRDLQAITGEATPLENSALRCFRLFSHYVLSGGHFLNFGRLLNRSFMLVEEYNSVQWCY